MKSKSKKVLVIGGGAWGSAISNLIAENKNQVFLSSNEPKVIKEINQKSTN